MRTHLSLSSDLDGMPLTFDAYQECFVLSLVCLDKWDTTLGSPYDCVVTGITYEHPGSRQTWYQSRTVCRIIKPWSKSSLPFYSYIVTLGIQGNNIRLIFLLTLIDLSSESPSFFLREDRTRLIYVLLEHLVDCFLVAVGLLSSSRVILILSSLKKFCPISSRLFHFPSHCRRY